MSSQPPHDAPIPMVGFGTYQIRDGEAHRCVRRALEVGYRHVDTAEGYRNENGVGRALREGMKKQGLTRDDLFVTTKLWPGRSTGRQRPKTYEATLKALEASLGRMQLEHVDLYLIHAPFPVDMRLEQWRALVDLQSQGKTRRIGVSNFNQAHIEEFKASGMPLPDANQIELHPWSQKPELVTYLQANQITPIAYSSLVPLSNWRHTEGQRSAKTQAMQADSLDPSSPFKLMAEKHGCTQAQVLLKWGLQMGYPVLPRSTNDERIRENFDLYSFELNKDDMDAIAGMDRGDGVAWSAGDPTLVP
jgi:2,5-diketo-D-gluconate reductase A